MASIAKSDFSALEVSDMRRLVFCLMASRLKAQISNKPIVEEISTIQIAFLTCCCGGW